jgi:phosphoribosylamine-glycine ligase
LDEFPLRLNQISALGVVMAARGYPGAYRKGVTVSPIPAFSDEKVLVFHASTQRDSDGRILTGGGRCFTVVGLDNDTLSAKERAYDAVKSIRFNGVWYRSDIGNKFFLD